MTMGFIDSLKSMFGSSGSSGGGSIPLESVALNYVKIKYEYKPQNKQGGGSGQHIAGYDRATNKSL